MTALIEGRWRAGERLAQESARDSEAGQLHHLAAAVAAHRRGEEDARERRLHLAVAAEPEQEAAAGLLRAHWALEEGNPAAALALLLKVQRLRPRAPRLLVLLARCYRDLGEWAPLRELLAESPGELSEEEHETLEREAHQGLIDAYGDACDPEGLRTLWRSMPERARVDPVVVERFAEQLCRCEAPEDVESFLRRELERAWNSPLARLYGTIEGLEPVPLLGHAERWLERHPRDPALLMSCGRLALRARLWGKARNYLEASVGILPTLEGYRELARTLEEMGDQTALAACRREALKRL